VDVWLAAIVAHGGAIVIHSAPQAGQQDTGQEKLEPA